MPSLEGRDKGGCLNVSITYELLYNQVLLKTKNSYYFRPTLADNGEIREEVVGVISSGNPERLTANSIAVYKISELLRLCQRISILRKSENNQS